MSTFSLNYDDFPKPFMKPQRTLRVERSDIERIKDSEARSFVFSAVIRRLSFTKEFLKYIKKGREYKISDFCTSDEISGFLSNLRSLNVEFKITPLGRRTKFITFFKINIKKESIKIKPETFNIDLLDVPT